MKRYLLAIIATLAVISGIQAQILKPVTWSSSVEMNDERNGRLIFKASIDEGWHLYGIDLPEGGPNPTTFTFDKVEGMTLNGDITPSRKPHEQVDMVFHLKLNWWEDKVDFYQDFTLNEPNGAYLVEASVRYQGCNDGSCIPPSTESFDFKGGNVASENMPSEETLQTDNKALSAPTHQKSSANKWWNPVVFTDDASDNTASIAESSWWYIFIWGFIGGLVALLTPCVWPMIPLTVSFFLKKSNSRRRSIADAFTYGCAIVVIYLVLGLAITLIFGASKLNDLATNAVFNLLFFLLLVVFAISFFGAFDIKLPSKWTPSTGYSE